MHCFSAVDAKCANSLAALQVASHDNCEHQEDDVDDGDDDQGPEPGQGRRRRRLLHSGCAESIYHPEWENVRRDGFKDGTLYYEMAFTGAPEGLIRLVGDVSVFDSAGNVLNLSSVANASVEYDPSAPVVVNTAVTQDGRTVTAVVHTSEPVYIPYLQLLPCRGWNYKTDQPVTNCRFHAAGGQSDTLSDAFKHNTTFVYEIDDKSPQSFFGLAVPNFFDRSGNGNMWPTEETDVSWIDVEPPVLIDVSVSVNNESCDYTTCFAKLGDEVSISVEVNEALGKYPTTTLAFGGRDGGFDIVMSDTYTSLCTRNDEGSAAICTFTVNSTFPTHSGPARLVVSDVIDLYGNQGGMWSSDHALLHVDRIPPVVKAAAHLVHNVPVYRGWSSHLDHVISCENDASDPLTGSTVGENNHHGEEAPDNIFLFDAPYTGTYRFNACESEMTFDTYLRVTSPNLQQEFKACGTSARCTGSKICSRTPVRQ